MGGGGGAPATQGDATWLHTFFDTDLWQNPGGDFSDTVSASLEVAGIGSYTWGPTPEMRQDVQEWLDQPESNFGWVLVGDEDARGATKRFDSRENSAEVRPMLTIEFTQGAETPTATPVFTPTPTQPPGVCVGDCGDDGEVNISDVIIGVRILLGAADVSDCEAFADAQGNVNISQLILGVTNLLNGCP